MGLLDGVRVGPLDTDRGENLGQVGGSSTARTLIRHHLAMHPPALTGALGRMRQQERTLAVDRVEGEAAIREAYETYGEPLPDDATVLGMVVRGDDEAPDLQVLTFTFALPSGRTGKGAIPYRGLSRSVAAGDQAVDRAKLKAEGLPWAAPAAAAPSGDVGDLLREAAEQLEESRRAAERMQGERDDAIADRDEVLGRMDDFLARMDGAPAPDSPAPDPAPAAAAPEAPAAAEPLVEPQPPSEPWDGFEQANAQEIRAKLRETRDPDLARAVLAWEMRRDGGAGRSTVIAAANEVLDRTPPE